MLNTVDEGIEAVRQGKIVIVVDDENRENEGDFIISGEKIRSEERRVGKECRCRWSPYH